MGLHDFVDGLSACLFTVLILPTCSCCLCVF